MAEITSSDILGKVMLVDLTYYSHDNKAVKQAQYYGTVIDANKEVIRIKQKDGTIFQIPADLSSTQSAERGEYHLKSTGEVVVNPDFISTWNLMLPNEDNQ